MRPPKIAEACPRSPTIPENVLLPPRRPRHPLPIVAKGLGSIENEARTVVSINFEMALNLLGMPQVIGIEEEEDVPFGLFGGSISRDGAISFCEVKDHCAVLAGNLGSDFASWWRMQLVYFILFLQRYFPLCPRLESKPSAPAPAGTRPMPLAAGARS